MNKENKEKFITKYPKIYTSFFKLYRRKITLNFIERLKFRKIIESREKYTIFDYRELAENIQIVREQAFLENNFYGNKLAIKKALGGKLSFYDRIEHGYYFGNLAEDFWFYPYNTRIITFGNKRKMYLEHKFNESSFCKKTEIILVGPYISYIDEILTKDEINEIKSKYGKILLVFPSHSIEGVNYNYDYSKFIAEIERVAKNFDSVFICLYWKDIQDNKHIEYENAGYTIVTAGHMYDTNFLARLKSIINISDYTMSNKLGTHLGYCVSLNKPHYLYNQKQIITGNRVEQEFSNRNTNEFYNSYYEEENEILECFGEFSEYITQKQKDCVAKYWGENKVTRYVLKK